MDALDICVHGCALVVAGVGAVEKSRQGARGSREPWLLVTSTRLAEPPPKRLVRLYRRRRQIQEAFRDLKSQHLGEGLERSRFSGVGRFRVLVLIASLAAFLLWLLGTATQSLGIDTRMRPPGPPNRRGYSRPYLTRSILTVESWRPALAEIHDAVGDPELWVASHQDALVLD